MLQHNVFSNIFRPGYPIGGVWEELQRSGKYRRILDLEAMVSGYPRPKFQRRVLADYNEILEDGKMYVNFIHILCL